MGVRPSCATSWIRRTLPVVRALTALVLAAIVSGCSTEDAAPADSGAPDATTDTAPNAVRTYAVSFFRLGFTTREGENTTDAWKKYGFDLDALCTNADDSQASKNTCKRLEGSSGDILTDGDNCIDNNFGSQLVTLIKAVDPAAETKIADGIKAGALTLVFELSDVAESGADDNAPGALFAAKSASGTANLDGNDVFDVDTISVTGGDIGKPIATLNGAITIENGQRVWNGTAEMLDLPAVFISGASGAIPIRGAHVQIELDTGRGMIGGYAAIPAVQNVVAGVLKQQKMCPGSLLYDNVIKNVERAADMPAQLPHDPSQFCASLSLGLGVELVPGSLGKVVPTGKPKADPCAKPDAGPDSADTSDASDVSDASDTSVEDASDASDAVSD